MTKVGVVMAFEKIGNLMRAVIKGTKSRKNPINAKNSEFHAAMGLCVLEDIELILTKRKEQSEIYDELLVNLPIQKIKIQENCDFNYAYYPILFKNEEITLKVKAALESENIFPRRYFYPSLSSLDYVKNSATPISDDCASRILCLPLYHELSVEQQSQVAKTIQKAIL